MKNQFQILREIGLEENIEIKRAKRGDYSKIGIHLLYPTIDELHDAFDTAQKDMFPAIYIHTSYTWRK